MEKLESLCMQLQQLKEKESALKGVRYALESKIVSLVPAKEEGTTTTKTDRYKVSVTTKLTRSIDIKEWDKIAGGSIPPGLEPVRTKTELDLKKYRAIETANPALFALVSRAVSAKPAKPSVKIVEEAA